MIKKDYCVIGLGRFGSALIDALTKRGNSVMALDENRTKVNAIAPLVAYSSVIDSTNVEMLKDSGLIEMDHVFVTIGENVEASIMTCAALLEIGITNITAKAASDRHEMVLEKMGIKDVVRPEKLTGTHTALRIISSTLSDVTFLSDKHSIIQITVENSDIFGRTLQDLKQQLKGVIISAIKRKRKVMIPDADTIIESKDILVIITKNLDIEKVEKIFN